MSAPVADQAAAQAAVLAAYQQQAAGVGDQLSGYLSGLWASLGPYLRDAQRRDFVGQAVPVVQGGIGHMRSITQAYLATTSGLSGGSSTPPGSARPMTTSSLRGGVSADDVYSRPFVSVWRQVDASRAAQGLPDSAPIGDEAAGKANNAGLSSALKIGATDLQLAKVHTTQQTLTKDPRVVGFRRVLEGTHSCVLCVVAATKLYHTADLMPIHPGCACDIAPIHKGDEGDGVTIDPGLLEAAHATVAAQFGTDSTAARRIRGALKGNGDPLLYRDVLVTHHDAELGPILRIRGQK